MRQALPNQDRRDHSLQRNRQKGYEHNVSQSETYHMNIWTYYPDFAIPPSTPIFAADLAPKVNEKAGHTIRQFYLQKGWGRSG